MKLNAKIVFGGLIVLAAMYYWFVARPAAVRGHLPPNALIVFYLFTFRMFPFSDVLWTIAGATLLYRGIEQARSD